MSDTIDGGTGPEGTAGAPAEPVTMIVTPIRLEYDFTAGVAQSHFLENLVKKTIVGQKCGEDGLVYVPPRGTDPASGLPTDIDVPLSTTGIVTTFCVVNVPFHPVDVPYVQATVLFDGADIGIMHLLQEVDPDEVRAGMRVEPVWEDEIRPTMTSIKYFRPTGEPDAPREAYADHI